MSLENTTWKHGDRTYRITALPGEAAFELAARLLRVAGPTLLALRHEIDPESERTTDPSAVFAGLDAKEMTAIRSALFAAVEVTTDASAGVYVRLTDTGPSFFARRTLEQYALLIECCRWNFADFFSGTSPLAPILGAMGAKKTTSPAT